MIRLNELKMPLGATDEEVKSAAAKALKIKNDDIKSFSLARRSIDSRKKDNIFLVYSVEVETDLNEDNLLAGFLPSKAFKTQRYTYTQPEAKRSFDLRPVVVGFGPAGMFAALTLAKAGLKPIVLERGGNVDERTKDVETFWTQRKLNTSSNVQFGEGGAGTFSDGKLTTGIKDPRCREVFLRFAEFGAPAEILYSATPHIGTDKLKTVVKNIRNKVIELGGEVKFNTRLVDIITANGFVQGITYENPDGTTTDIETDALILAIGHSARDTFELIYKKGLEITQKPFSVGTRIEHPQEHINKAQYGKLWNSPLLPAADYKLACHPPHGRGLYTFCMCPGGTVVAASSEEGGMVVNGMSEYARDKENANCALLVGIEPPFDTEHPLAGMYLQRDIEQKAFRIGGGDYTAPAQLLGDFLKGKPSTKLGAVNPSCPTGVTPTDIRQVLPKKVTDTIAGAIADFDRKLNGFNLYDAVLTAPESRSSSPIRICRDEFFQATRLRGLYPSGEGAGYAGGIVSAAVDGIRCAEAVLNGEY
ncbi:MAG: FAD-binding protein [Clostridia bacterium]|nr:FAD-binding protein [Clostridia bacterium]